MLFSDSFDLKCTIFVNKTLTKINQKYSNWKWSRKIDSVHESTNEESTESTGIGCFFSVRFVASSLRSAHLQRTQLHAPVKIERKTSRGEALDILIPHPSSPTFEGSHVNVLSRVSHGDEFFPGACFSSLHEPLPVGN